MVSEISHFPRMGLRPIGGRPGNPDYGTFNGSLKINPAKLLPVYPPLADKQERRMRGKGECMSNLRNIFQRLLISMVIVLLVLPVSLFLMIATATKAEAAEPKKKVATETIKINPPVLEASKGLRKDGYSQGQSINAIFVFPSKEKLKVWAKIGNLDPSFPETENLKAEGDGAWRLVTPELTANLRVGDQLLEIFAQKRAQSAGISCNRFSVNLIKREKTFPLKTAVNDNEAIMAWNPIKGAGKYLVEWNIRGSSSVLIKVTSETRVNLKNLLPGTFYEIQISAINTLGDLVAIKKTTLKTLGEAPVAKVAGVTRKEITPAIGGGVSTSKVAQKTAEPATPQESPKPKEENESRGWSRLLVALAILIIAAGAAIGGYYGYEWYAGKSRDREGPDSKSSSRW